MKQFIKLENTILFNQEIRDNSKKLFVILRQKANIATNIVNVSYTQLSIVSKIQKSHLKQYLDELKENKLITFNYNNKKTEIKIINKPPTTDFSSIIFDYIIGKNISDVLNYYYIINLLKMNKDIKKLTNSYNNKSKFNTVGEIIETMLNLSEVGLGSFKYKFELIDENEKNEQLATTQVTRQNKESINKIEKQEENITDYREYPKYMQIKLEYDRAKQMLDCYRENENDKGLDEEIIMQIKEAIIKQVEIVKGLEAHLEVIKNELIK